jgi:tRNA A-37 threonylcarbamoyl transferase component Bud32
MAEINSTARVGGEATVIPLPDSLASLRAGDWLRVDADNPLIGHISATYWMGADPPTGWEVARLSGAVYLYREISTRWTLVSKYYHVKSSSSALEYAQRELGRIEEASGYISREGARRCIQGLGAWGGVLFLEHVPGLSLADVIAARVSLPGQLRAGLKSVGHLLSNLHKQAQQVGVNPDFDTALRDNRDYVKDLCKYGVLKGEPGIVAGLDGLFDDWTSEEGMRDYIPTRIHGDATTTNFMLPEEGRVIALDWERMKTADPAADMGRMTAELTHSVRKHGGDSVEAEALIATCFQAYVENRGAAFDAASFRMRARFYEGASLLRIARNGWIPRLERMTMVSQAMAVLGASSR